MTVKSLALIVEDNEDQALVFEAAVKRAGYEVEVIADGTIARQRLDEVVPALVVLDLHIPGMSGGALLAYIRADGRLADVPIILATADAAFASSLQSQADLVLLKPISFSQLSELARRYFGQSHTQDLPPAESLA